MEDSAVRNTATGPHLPTGAPHLPAAAKCGEPPTPTAEHAGTPAPATMGRIRAAGTDALGHMKHTKELFWHYWAPVLAMLSLIAFESTELMSSAPTLKILAKFIPWIGHPLGHQSLELLNLTLRKTGHVIAYALLCFSWLLLLRGSYWLRHEYQLCLRGGIPIRRLWWRPVWAALALLCTVAVAVADELHQMSLPGRTGLVRDMLLDISAALIAAALVWGQAQRRCRVAQVGPLQRQG